MSWMIGPERSRPRKTLRRRKTRLHPPSRQLRRPNCARSCRFIICIIQHPKRTQTRRSPSQSRTALGNLPHAKTISSPRTADAKAHYVSTLHDIEKQASASDGALLPAGVKHATDDARAAVVKYSESSTGTVGGTGATAEISAAVNDSSTSLSADPTAADAGVLFVSSRVLSPDSGILFTGRTWGVSVWVVLWLLSGGTTYTATSGSTTTTTTSGSTGCTTSTT